MVLEFDKDFDKIWKDFARSEIGLSFFSYVGFERVFFESVAELTACKLQSWGSLGPTSG